MTIRVKTNCRPARKRCCLIDDEDMILDVGSNILEGLGYRVMIATGGKQD